MARLKVSALESDLHEPSGLATLFNSSCYQLFTKYLHDLTFVLF